MRTQPFRCFILVFLPSAVSPTSREGVSLSLVLGQPLMPCGTRTLWREMPRDFVGWWKPCSVLLILAFLSRGWFF